MGKITQKAQKERALRIVEKLKSIYPEAICALNWGGEPWKLLVMGRLSAQCTDKRVNIVCEELFSVYPTARALTDAPLEKIEKIVRPCGLYKTKALSIKEACAMLEDEFGGVLPDDMDTLLRFPGVGRKIANLLLGDVHGKGSIVADTHCIRICGRFGFYDETLKDPYKVELIMSKYIPEAERCDFCHRIVQFGRDTCTARSPKCDICTITECKKNKKDGLV